MRALVSIDIQRNAILLSIIDSSFEAVSEEIRHAQQATIEMFDRMRMDVAEPSKGTCREQMKELN